MAKHKLETNDKKYAAEFDEHTGQLKLYRHGELWDEMPKYSKFFIAIIYDLIEVQRGYNAMFKCIKKCTNGSIEFEGYALAVNLELNKCLAEIEELK